VALGISISRDELAIGFSRGLAHLSVIALQAFIAAQLGLAIGAKMSERLRGRTEQIAGVVLYSSWCTVRAGPGIEMRSQSWALRQSAERRRRSSMNFGGPHGIDACAQPIRPELPGLLRGSPRRSRTTVMAAQRPSRVRSVGDTERAISAGRRALATLGGHDGSSPLAGRSWPELGPAFRAC
jgi:hypothetical protein